MMAGTTSEMSMDTDREHSEQHTKQSRWGLRGMTFRDWLPIAGTLLVALVIALGIWGITWQLEKLENQRAETERELAEQRAQDEALQAYLDQMSQLILERKLLEAEPGDPVHTLAQARTSTVILRLDAAHNESVTRFLISSDLSLRSKDSARLLRGSTLSHAKLGGAHLPNADLGDADLSNALLDNADLVAYLPNADLSGASLIGADLSDANLVGADLSEANLIGADLSRSVLDNANLSGADLDNANLEGADGITNERLDQKALSLEGATMPEGQKYENWQKDQGRLK
jgi:cell division protein FtsB